jgi:hypothetical protein
MNKYLVKFYSHRTELKIGVVMMLAAVTTRTRLRLQEQSVEHMEACFFPTKVTRGLY